MKRPAFYLPDVTGRAGRPAQLFGTNQIFGANRITNCTGELLVADYPEPEPYPAGVPAYRFFEHQHRCFYDEGSLKLTSLHTMAKKESLGPLWDPDEGRSTVVASGLLRRGHDEVIDRVINVGGVPTILDNFKVTTVVVDHWILCLTDDQSSSRLECYDDGVTVTDIHALAAAIQSASDGQLGAPKVGKVSYLSRQRAAGGHHPSASPFIKGPRFEPESEVRIAWPILGGGIGNGELVIQSEALREHLAAPAIVRRPASP